MKRIPLAHVALSIGLASAALPALAQNAADTLADFGPPTPADAMQQSPQIAPAPADTAPADLAPLTPQPAATELAPAQTQLAPPAASAYEPGVTGETRSAAPEAPPPARTRGADAQTGPYLGRGLFNNYGPNDFGA